MGSDRRAEAPSDRPALALLRSLETSRNLNLIDTIWDKPDVYVQWPRKALLFAPGSVYGHRHQYTDEQRRFAKASGTRITYGPFAPAVVAFRAAGGFRPYKLDGTTKWPICHIYHGFFLAPGRDQTLNATSDGLHFSQAAGLVALHFFAGMLLGSSPYFAWLLRYEAYKRFAYDPDHVFGDASQETP